MLKVIFYLRFAMANLIIMVIFHYSTVSEFPLFCNMKIIKPWVMIGVITSSCRKANNFLLHLWETFVTLVAKIHVYYTCWNFSVTLMGNFFTVVGNLLQLWELLHLCEDSFHLWELLHLIKFITLVGPTGLLCSCKIKPWQM